MKAVLPEADVAGYEALIPDLSLPDPDDRHVLAAAIAGKASTIVTWNLKDFPASALSPHGVLALSPDDFLLNLHAMFKELVIESTMRARLNLRKTLPSTEDFLFAMERQGLTSFTAILRRSKAKLT